MKEAAMDEDRLKGASNAAITPCKEVIGHTRIHAKGAPDTTILKAEKAVDGAKDTACKAVQT